MAEHQAVTRLFLQHRDMLLSYIHALVRDADVAEDLFQEVGVRILEREELPCPDEAFPAWCRGVARNLILHHWRQQRRQKTVPGGLLVDAIDQAYAELDGRADIYQRRSAALAACLEQMPTRQRNVLEMRYYERLTSEEIGQLLQRSAEAVRKELSRLRGQLLKCIEVRLSRGEGDES